MIQTEEGGREGGESERVMSLGRREEGGAALVLQEDSANRGGKTGPNHTSKLSSATNLQRKTSRQTAEEREREGWEEQEGKKKEQEGPF